MKTKLTVFYERYKRYSGVIMKATIERDTLMEALLVMSDNMDLCYNREMVEEEEMDEVDIIASIINCNVVCDDCLNDYIFELKNETTGDVIIEGNEEYYGLEW